MTNRKMNIVLATMLTIILVTIFVIMLTIDLRNGSGGKYNPTIHLKC
jgi:hypothetical protein